MSGQPSPQSVTAPAHEGRSAEYWRELATSRGQLLHDMMDKWAERRVEFLKAKRGMAGKIIDLKTRERTITRRIAELERTLLIVRSLSGHIQSAEPQFSIQHHIDQALPPIDQMKRGGDAGGQQE